MTNASRAIVAIGAVLFVMPAGSIHSQAKQAEGISVSALVPSAIAQGSANLGLTVRGAGFNSKSQIRLNGEHRQTTYVSSSELRTLLLAADVTSPRTALIAVFTPGAGTTQAVALTITGAASAPVDTEPPRFTTTPTNLTIPATSAEGADVALILPLATDNSGSVSVSSVPQSGIGTLFRVGTTTVVYTAVDPSGNKATITSTVTVTPLPPPPTMSISALEPSSAIPGAQALSITLGVRGAGFTNGMTIRWNGGARSTTFLSSSLLQTFIATSDIISPGETSVTVFDPSTGASTPAADFYIDASKSGVPRIVALGKTSGIAGADIGFAINGEGFVVGSVVRLNGNDLPGNRVSINGSRILGVTIPGAMLTVPGAYRITVFNAGPNGGESNAAQLTMTAQ